MRPSQIRVFDGLRITVDHVNHLQGALASGFEDFREALGLGLPQTGLGVSIAEDGTATIEPGTAFDQQKNRLACDSPLILKVTFGPQDVAKFICLKYEQVEDGAVEGRPTLIWDSCSALVRDAWPDAAENLVVLARVLKDSEGKLHVRARCEEEESPSLAEITQPSNEAAPSAAPVGSVPAPSVGVESPTPVAPSPPNPAPQPSEAESPPAPATAAPDTAPVAQPAPDASQARANIRQGTIKLGSDPGAASFLRAVVAPALRAKVASGAFDLAFPLVQTELVADTAVGGLTTHSVFSGELLFPAAADAAQPHFAFECVSHGEATAAADGLLQFAASTMDVRPLPPAPGTVWPAANFTARGVMELPFANWSAAPDASRPLLPADLLAGMQLVAQIAASARGLDLGLKLFWSGSVSEDSLKLLETQDIQFSWQINLGWKSCY